MMMTDSHTIMPFNSETVRPVATYSLMLTHGDKRFLFIRIS
jgi:hypothetical protein